MASIIDKATALATSITNYGAAVKTRVATDETTTAAKVDNSQVGAALGIAPLGGDQKIPAPYLPSFVDDVLEFPDLASFPVAGETGKIYVAVNSATSADPSRQYRWSGTTYTEISPSPGSSDAVPEGAVNLYFQASRVLASILTGLSTATNAVITAADPLLVALGKLQAQASANLTSIGTNATNIGNLTTTKANKASPALTGQPTLNAELTMSSATNVPAGIGGTVDFAGTHTNGYAGVCFSDVTGALLDNATTHGYYRGGSTNAFLWTCDNAGVFVTAGDMGTTSDERLKENWRDFDEDFISQLAQVKHGVYDRKDTKITQVGVSAQSLEKVKLLSYAVLEDDNGYKAVAYGQAALAASIQLARRSEQQREFIEQQMSLIVEMAQTIASMQKRLTALEQKPA